MKPYFALKIFHSTAGFHYFRRKSFATGFAQIPPCAITLAVKEFQVFNKLEPTGQLTKETRALMAKDRCGNPDVKCGE